MKKKDDLIEILESQAVEAMERQGDLFSSKPQLYASCSLPNLGDWKEVATRYVEENQRLKAHISRLTGKRQRIE